MGGRFSISACWHHVGSSEVRRVLRVAIVVWTRPQLLSCGMHIEVMTRHIDGRHSVQAGALWRAQATSL